MLICLAWGWQSQANIVEILIHGCVDGLVIRMMSVNYSNKTYI